SFGGGKGSSQRNARFQRIRILNPMKTSIQENSNYLVLLIRIVVRVLLGRVVGAGLVLRGGVDGVELDGLGALVDEVVPLAGRHEDREVILDLLVDVQLVLAVTDHDAALARLEAEELVV